MLSSLRVCVGATLWWAEGTKSRRDKRWKRAVTYPLEITSTDPNIVRIFLDFIRRDIVIDAQRLKIQIQIHRGDNRRVLEEYWSKVCRVPISQFHKTIIRPMGNKVGKTRGTCKVRYHDKAAFLRAKLILDKIIAKVV